MTALNLPKNWAFIKGSGTLMHSPKLIKKKIHPWQRKLSRLITVKKRVLSVTHAENFHPAAYKLSNFISQLEMKNLNYAENQKKLCIFKILILF